jgi:type III protein arginine methyltransferase
LTHKVVEMNDDVARAIQSAKYRDIVQLNLEDDDEGTAREISLVAVLDAEHGGVQWSNADAMESSGGDDARKRRHLTTKRWFFPMLNDHKRNELYELAIETAAAEVKARLDSFETPDSTVQAIQCLDIGSGTGLLAMISAQKMLEGAPRHDINVRSLEMSRAMAMIAEETVRSNSMQNLVDVQEGHSCEIPPISPKAMLCTSELLESGLLAEGWIPAMRDAWERHLHPAAIVVPQAAKVFAQVVEGPGISNFWGPHERIHGFPGGKSLSLAVDSDDTHVLLGGAGAEYGVRVPVHIQELLDDSSYPIRALSSPLEVLCIRVDSKDALPTVDGQTRSTCFIPTATGSAQGVIYWWELGLFGDSLKYNTASDKSHWQDHWQQCLYVFAKPPEDCVVVQEGVAATLKAFHDDFSISFDILSNENDDQNSVQKRRRTTDGPSPLITPSRAWQLNDTTRSVKLRDAIAALLAKLGKDSHVLDLSDFSLCAMMAALLGGSNVSSLEASSTRLPEATARIAQISNCLPLDNASFQLIRCHPEQLTVELLGGSQAEIVVAEPHYEILEGWELHEALNYLYTLRDLKRRNVVKKDALSLPQRARIMGQVFESQFISGAYGRCASPLRGFNHGVANRLYSWDKDVITLPSWQYKMTTLSSPFEIASLDYNSCTVEQEASENLVQFTKAGTCHGMVVWVDYSLPIFEQGVEEILSTRGRPHNQLIRLLDQAVAVGQENSRFCCRASIGRADGSLEEFSFQISVQRIEKDGSGVPE